METRKFRTRQETHQRIHPKGKDYIIALDAGYSSMKVYFENGYFCFPSYAKKLDDDMLNISCKRDILYRDEETKEVYMVGYTAQDMIASTNTNDTDGTMFSRKRYSGKLFKLLCNTALGIVLSGKQKNDNRGIVVQTGLPSSYKKADMADIKKALCKPAHFSIKVGDAHWITYNLSLNENNIFVMEQPAGSYYSAIMKTNGEYVPNAKKFMFSNVLVMDIGFGTFDFYGIKTRAVACSETIDDLGMREVLKHTSKKIFEEMNEDIRVQALQKPLETGKVICFNEDEMRTEENDISPLLEAASEEVFENAIEMARSTTSSFRDYNYLIVTGGTGEAWYQKILDYFKNMKNLHIIPANINDNIPFIYQNARGYYLFRYMINKKKS